MPPDGHLWLVGMMGSGKSVVGRAVAERLGVPFRDADAEVEHRVGCTIAELFSRDGEAAFRSIEAEVVADLAATRPAAVIAAGGGSVLQPGNRTVMAASGLVVWLRASPDVLASRVGRDADRPLLAGRPPGERLEEILEERDEMYRAVADHEVDTEGGDVAAVTEEVVRWWRRS